MLINYSGIQTNNLKNIDVSIKKNNIIIIKGVSGSGKSSLAIDTIHKISEDELYQLLNIKDNISLYSVKGYEGILPSVCLRQENYNKNPRSTIATYYNLDFYFCNLFAYINKVSTRLFHFNINESACKHCNGLGTIQEPDIHKIVNIFSPISKNLFKPWQATNKDYYRQSLQRFCEEQCIDTETKFCNLNIKEQEILLSGESNEKYFIKFICNGKKRTKTGKYKGPLLELNERIKKDSISIHQKKYFTEAKCLFCKGGRFDTEILTYKAYGKSLAEVYLMEASELVIWIQKVCNKKGLPIVEKKSLNKILKFLLNMSLLNLGYLNLNRAIPSLSGGELQRLRLVKAVNSQFNNFIYILDEPTSGLHPSEWHILSDIILGLKNKNNTVLIVEHNTFLDNISDNIIYLGVGGGMAGGHLIKKSECIRNENIIEKYFFEATKQIKIKNASSNNVSNLSTVVPINTLVGVCGLSGSGKTTFLKNILTKYIENCVYVNQSPIRGNSYSILATIFNVLKDIQTIFAKKSNVEIKNFWYASSGKGQCKLCSGTGVILEDSGYIKTSIICPDCNGKRFSYSSLKYKYENYNIYEFLNLDIKTLIELIPKQYKKTNDILAFAISIGLGYLNLFQNTSSLSGGEAQRAKLINKVFKFRNKKIYLLDEPFRGVDKNNILRMIGALYKLIENGYTIYIAEHNPLALSYVSYIIEFGPKSGQSGGKIIASGELKDFKKNKKSIFAKYL